MLSSYSVVPSASENTTLQYDRTKIEKLILFIFDRFEFHVELNENKEDTRSLLWILGGALAGGYLGHLVYGKVGAAVGGAGGGLAGYKFAGVPIRNVWEEVKSQLGCLFTAVYNFIVKLKKEDYDYILQLMIRDGSIKDLAKLAMEIIANTLGTRVSSNLIMA